MQGVLGERSLGLPGRGIGGLEVTEDDFVGNDNLWQMNVFAGSV